jgi:hypothetical protein
MTLRNGHGNGGGVPRIEVLPANELPAGVPGDARGESPTDRGEGGRFAEGNGLAADGGHARAGHTRLARKVALGDSFADPRFDPYARAARAFRRAHVTTLARSVGGGHCGPGPASIVASAALQLAGSRFAFEVLADMALGSRLADSSRQNLLAAHELCAREAAARPKGAEQFPWFTAAPPPTRPKPERSAIPTTPGTPTGDGAPDGQLGGVTPGVDT